MKTGARSSKRITPTSDIWPSWNALIEYSNNEQIDHLESGAVAILLGELWLRELTAKRIDELTGGGIADAMKSLDWDLPNSNDPNLAATLETLQIDYCQLLVGPQGHISPVESVWVAEQFQSETVDSMQAFFELLPGYVPPDSFHDHIGVQLDFAGNLLNAAGQTAKSSADSEAEQESHNAVNTFVRQRMAWTKPMLQKVKQQSTTEFYSQLADVTLRFLGLFEPETIG